MEEKTFSQEELNSIVSERLNKEKEKYDKQVKELTTKAEAYEKQIATFTSQLEEINKKVATHESELQERDNKIHEYETQSVKMRVAHEVGIPYELASRLSGTTEEEIKTDAESIKGLLGQTKVVPPLKGTEEVSGGNDLENAFRQLSRNLQNK